MLDIPPPNNPKPGMKNILFSFVVASLAACVCTTAHASAGGDEFAADPRPAALPRAAKQTGLLQIATEPGGAQVFINGRQPGLRNAMNPGIRYAVVPGMPKQAPPAPPTAPRFHPTYITAAWVFAWPGRGDSDPARTPVTPAFHQTTPLRPLIIANRKLK